MNNGMPLVISMMNITIVYYYFILF